MRFRTLRWRALARICVYASLPAAVLLVPFALSGAAPSAAVQPGDTEPADVALFRATSGGEITPVIVELRGDPTVTQAVAAELRGRALSVDQLAEDSIGTWKAQDQFLATLYLRDIRALLKTADVRQIDGSVRHIEWRFTYLANGMVLYVATADLDRLRSQPEVLSVEIPETESFHLDRAIDYSLGTAPNVADRRQAVYGANQELSPLGSLGHAETPKTTTLDGQEGQGINIAVIDTGVDWRHPMFGGIGLGSPTPRVSGNPPAPGDNTKVIYYYSLSSPGDATDDFGHGTLVASCAAGFKVDGDTDPQAGYGVGRDGTGIGPTLNGAMLHGTAPQARIMAYKVCGPANNCVGDIALAIEDAASPFTLVSSGNSGPNPVAKPVADVINLSLGSASGSRANINSRMANNAALAGTILVTSAGNSGGIGTVGSPSVAPLAISVAASLDPGSVSVGAVLAPGQIPNENSAGKTPAEGAAAGPPEENGAASEANSAQPGERADMKLFPVAGAGPILGGSVSAHYVFVDLRPAGSTAPSTVTNRIALVKFTGTFAAAANSIAPMNPAGILLITATESATAVQVLNGIPTFTLGAVNGDYLIDLMRAGDPGDGDAAVDVPQGTVSQLPLRLAEGSSPSAYQPAMAGFSSRGPYQNVSPFQVIKPDVTGPGVGIVGAATPDGIPDDAIGLASPSGYTQANGTSFSGPITAGAMALLRQHVRENLQLDTTDLADPMYRRKRFDSVTVARALLQNAATNLRDGMGAPQPDGPGAAAVNELGSGHINVADALDARAIMVAPFALLADVDPVAANNQPEFNRPTREPPALDAQGNLPVLIPTASFATVPLVGVDADFVRVHKVILRDVTNGGGAGAYDLSFQDNRNATMDGFAVSFLAADGATDVTSVSLPSGGTAEFFVKTVARGSKILIPDLEITWYVKAVHAASGRALRMPFYYRAVRPLIPNIAAPVQNAPGGVDNAGTPPACGTDADAAYSVNFTYTKPAGGPDPAGFRVQEATRFDELFSDPADETLQPGTSGTSAIVSNSRWTGTQNWRTQTNPSSNSPAYFGQAVAGGSSAQNDTLTMLTAVNVPAGGATLLFDTNQMLQNTTHAGHVEISSDNFQTFNRIASFTGVFTGLRELDIAAFSGRAIKVRFRLSSGTAIPLQPQPIGWYIENIRLVADDFRTIAEPGPGELTVAVSGRVENTYHYRVAGQFSTPDGAVIGPYSNRRCVTVDIPNAPPTVSVGNGFAIDEGASGMLSGTGSDPEGGTLTYAWTQVAPASPAATIDNPDMASTSFTAPAVSADTTLTFRLTVTDEENATASADIAVLVRQVNVPPVANAGADFAVDERTTALLSGSASSDPDGDTLAYEWTQIAGPSVTIANFRTAAASFTAPDVATDSPLTFRLTVTDPAGAGATDEMVVTVRNLDAAPQAPIGNNAAGGLTPASALLLGLLGLVRRRRAA